MRCRIFFLLLQVPMSPLIADDRGFKQPSLVSWMRSQIVMFDFSGQVSIRWSSVSGPELQRGHSLLFERWRLFRRSIVGS